MSTPMIGYEYLTKLGRNTGGFLKKLVSPLLKDGIGDKMDKGNLWIVPGFTLFAFAILWTTKLSKLALAEASCRTAMIYDLRGTQLDDDAQRHCLTSKRYFVGINETFLYNQKWRVQRQVKNPEWVLWFWFPIVFVMYVLTRYMWTLLMENQGINFENIVNASKDVVRDKDGVTVLDEKRLMERLPVVTDNFKSAYSTHAFAAFITFEIMLVLAPLLLLTVILPLIIGGNYRTWGLDVLRAVMEGNEWQGSPLTPFFAINDDRPVMPLIPRITYCDYHWMTLGNEQIITYRCYLDATWHERTALFTWIMLVLLTVVNLLNLFFWLLWAYRMHNRETRMRWVMKKWLNGHGFQYHPKEKKYLEHFASQFKMGNLLLFYFIEAHTDRTVARTFANQLYTEWFMQRQTIENSYIPTTPSVPQTPAYELMEIGWSKPPNIGQNGVEHSRHVVLQSPKVQEVPTAPPYPLIASEREDSPEDTPKKRTKREPIQKKVLAKLTTSKKKETDPLKKKDKEKEPLKKQEKNDDDEFSSETDSVTDVCE